MTYLRRLFLYVAACALILLAGISPTRSVQAETIGLDDASTALSVDKVGKKRKGKKDKERVGGSVSGALVQQAPPGENEPIVGGLATTQAGLSGALSGSRGGEIGGQLEPVPEPSTGWLLTTALVSLFLWGVRRASQQPRGHELGL